MKPTVYLAGPVSGCYNEAQMLHWRKSVKRELKDHFNFIDPTDKRDNWDPKLEIVDIDTADVVLANLWKESIGTVIGIIQARRRGKPVLLVDSNHIKSKPLEAFVGPENVVTSIEKAIRILRDQIAPSLKAVVTVKKRKGKQEPFSFRKLQRSVNSACDNARVDDALLPVFIAQRAYKLLRQKSRDRAINTDEIRQTVFDCLDELADAKDELYPESLKNAARSVRETWEEQELVKNDLRQLEQLRRENAELADTVRERDTQIFSLNQQIEYLSQHSGIGRLHRVQASEEQVPTFIEQIDVLNNRFSYLHFMSEFDNHESTHSTAFVQAIEALANYVGALRRGARPGDIARWLRSYGCAAEFAPRESEITRNNSALMKKRICHFNGQHVVLEKHLKFGRERLYFEIVANEHLVIGSIGKHLPVSQSKK